MADAPARLLCSYVRPDERQSLFIIEWPQDGIQLVEDIELWEEPQPGNLAACYHYYPTIFPEQRFADFDAALAYAREHFPWIDGSPSGIDDQVEMNKVLDLVGMREG